MDDLLSRLKKKLRLDPENPYLLSEINSLEKRIKGYKVAKFVDDINIGKIQRRELVTLKIISDHSQDIFILLGAVIVNDSSRKLIYNQGHSYAVPFKYHKLYQALSDLNPKGTFFKPLSSSDDMPSALTQNAYNDSIKYFKAHGNLPIRGSRYFSISRDIKNTLFYRDFINCKKAKSFKSPDKIRRYLFNSFNKWYRNREQNNYKSKYFPLDYNPKILRFEK